MFAKKLVRDIDDVYDQNLRDKFSRLTLDHDLLDEMLKDAHLLEGHLQLTKSLHPGMILKENSIAKQVVI